MLCILMGVCAMGLFLAVCGFLFYQFCISPNYVVRLFWNYGFFAFLFLLSSAWDVYLCANYRHIVFDITCVLHYFQ